MSHYEYQVCIDACIRCAQACERCASACLQEFHIDKMAECIRLDHDCADACRQSAAFMSRGSMFIHEACQLSAAICEACAEECQRHPMDHCQRCADACRHCAEECQKMMAGMAMA